MKTSIIAALILCSSSLVACATETIGSPDTDPPVAPPEDTKAAVEKPHEEDKKPEPPTACSSPLQALTCPSLDPAPTKRAEISAFVKDSAIPLRCGEDDAALWDVTPLIDLYGDNKIFMMGEVHGTNEIGIVSSLLFEQLALSKKVNVLAYELPMDYELMLSHYVETGSGAEDWLDAFDPNMFGSILTRTARELSVKGIPIRIAAVDTPMTTGFPLSAIKALAANLSTQKETALQGLPSSIDYPPSSEDEQAVEAYYDHIMASKSAICTELSAADCDRLDAMTHALWVATMLDSLGGDELWFARREVVIYYNMRTAMPSASDRMFLHMGAAHTNKYEFSGGSRMTHEYALTKDQVFSVAPAYGDGSVIEYSGEMDVPAEPLTLTKALTDAPPNPMFISTTRPTKTCEENPFGLESEGRSSSGTRAETYDGYIHYGKLTPSSSPDQTTFERDIAIATETKSKTASELTARLRAYRAKIQAKERSALRR